MTDKENSRTILLKDFYRGYKDLDKTADETITHISFDIPSKNAHINFEKVSRRTHLDIASVNSAAQIVVENNIIRQAHISAGGVGPTPMCLLNTCDFLENKILSIENVLAANEILQSEISPISDVRGSAEYKRTLLRQLFYAHFITLFPTQITLEKLI